MTSVDPGDGAADAELLHARHLLRQRPGACPAEIRAGFRQAVRELRPDLVGGPAGQLDELRWARDVLLASAGSDRRRRARDRPTPYDAALLRRATWGLDDRTDRQEPSYL